MAEIVDPADNDSQYAWAGNVGWINAEPGGDGGSGISLSEGALEGWLWSANTGWISLSCANTDSCGNVDYGVSLDGSGVVSGHAWSPNVGWISFSCENTDSCGAVDYRVSLTCLHSELERSGKTAIARQVIGLIGDHLLK